MLCPWYLIQRSPLFCANIFKKDPGRARQNSLATAVTNFFKTGAQNRVELSSPVNDPLAHWCRGKAIPHVPVHVVCFDCICKNNNSKLRVPTAIEMTEITWVGMQILMASSTGTVQGSRLTHCRANNQVRRNLLLTFIYEALAASEPQK